MHRSPLPLRTLCGYEIGRLGGYFAKGSVALLDMGYTPRNALLVVLGVKQNHDGIIYGLVTCFLRFGPLRSVTTLRTGAPFLIYNYLSLTVGIQPINRDAIARTCSG